MVGSARTRKRNGRKLGRVRAAAPPTPHFCAPFTYASSPLSESLEQARNVKEICRQIVNSPF